MKLTKIKLGKLIELCEEKNSDNKYKLNDVKGISIQKRFIETKADMQGVSLKPYLLVKPDYFAYVTVTSRNGEKITLAHNTTNDTYIVSSSYVVFKVSRPELLDSDYLFMYFNRPEFDRYSRFNSWGSAREVFSWNDMCDIDFDLPPIEIQKKYVAIYKNMVENQKSYERGLDDLKLVCDANVEMLMRQYENESISEYLSLVDEKNNNKIYGLDSIVGVSQEKKIIPTKADASTNDLSKFIVIKPLDFVYNPRNGIAVGLNQDDKNYIISWNNTAFRITKNDLLPEYLFMFLCRKEWDRKVKFDSWGSSTEVYDFKELKETRIPIPSLDVQETIVDIYKVFNERKELNEKLKSQIKDICPILIKGAIKEAEEQ